MTNGADTDEDAVQDAAAGAAVQDAAAGGPAIRIALADDQELVRLGLRMVLETQEGLEIVGEAADGLEAAELAERTPIDVLLMDVRMPGVDGIEATERITRRGERPRILVLTTFDLDEYAFAALRAGASGFLLKDARPGDLVAAIRSVHSGDGVLAPRVTRRMIEHFTTAPVETADPASGDELEVLTPREREFLVAIAEGLSNDELAARFVLAPSTVKTHIGRLLQKLDARDRVQLVIFAYEHGLAGR